jgi:hypothetical protein
MIVVKGDAAVRYREKYGKEPLASESRSLLIKMVRQPCALMPLGHN